MEPQVGIDLWLSGQTIGSTGLADRIALNGPVQRPEEDSGIRLRSQVRARRLGKRAPSWGGALSGRRQKLGRPDDDSGPPH